MCKTMPPTSPAKPSESCPRVVESDPDPPSMEDEMTTLQEKMKRVSKFLQEIKQLSPACEESIEEEAKERQIFLRRLLQVNAELQDARDILHSASRGLLSPRQFAVISSSADAEHVFEDPSHDPSVRFFGLDWQQLFTRSFALSLNVQIIKAQMLEASLGEDKTCLDLVLLNSVLKDLARIEVDVTSHGEAVLNGRLSKSQQRIIQLEQSKYNALTPSPSFNGGSKVKVTKSASFRDSSKKASRPIARYKKNKTTDLHKLSVGSSSSEYSDEWQEVLHDCDNYQEETHIMVPKRKTSFIQNVSNIFKNIR